MLARLALLLLFATPGFAQDTVHVSCKNCDGKGAHDCTKHKGFLDKEHEVEFCSVATDCKVCGGSLLVDCKVCKNEAVERAIEAKKQAAAAWLGERRKTIDEQTRNMPLLYLKSAHVDLCFAIRPLTVGKDKLDTHTLMHLYMQRIEALRQLFLDTFELRDQDLPGRLQIYMFRDQQDHTLIGPRVTGMGGGASTGTKLMGLESVYSMWHDLRSMADDTALYRNIVHHVTHLLLSNMLPSQWLGNRKQGWLDAGLAHWFEDKVTGKCANFCYEEVALMPGAGFKGGRWRVPVRKLVEAGKAKGFAELSTLNTDQLSFEDHAVSFAFVDFLISSYGGAKFRDLMRLIKQPLPTRDALQKVYGQNPLSIDGVFQEWVKATYPLVEKN